MKKSALLLIMAVILCFMLVSCGLFGGETTDPDTKPRDGEWTAISNPDVKTAVTQLLKTVHTTLADVSTSSVNASNPEFTLDTDFAFTLNDVKYVLSFKTKFQRNNVDNLLMAMELIDDKTKKVVLGAYYGKPSGTTDINLYVKINNGNSGKLKFDLESGNALNEFFPIVNFNISEISTWATAISAVIETKGQFTGRKRQVGNDQEIEYGLNIDFTKTLKKLAETLTLGSKGFDDIFKKPEDKEAFDKIIESFFGVKVDKLATATLPASTLKLGFTSFADKLTALSVDFELAAAASGSSSIFGGKKTTLSAVMNKLSIQKDYKNLSIPFFGSNEYLTYKRFINDSTTTNYSSYGISLNVKDTEIEHDDMIEFEIRAEFSLFDENSGTTSNEFLLEVTKKGEEDPNWAIYLYGGALYLFTTDANTGLYGFYKRYPAVDIMVIFNEAKDKINTVFNTQMGVMQIISSLFGAMQLTEDALNLNITADLINTFILDFGEFVEFIDETLITVDLVDDLADIGIDLVDYINKHKFKFTIEFDDANPFVYELTDSIVFPDEVING